MLRGKVIFLSNVHDNNIINVGQKTKVFWTFCGPFFCGKVIFCSWELVRCPKNFLRILEHAGELPHKFQADPLTRSRDLGFQKLKNFQKVDPGPPRRGHIFGDFSRFFIDFFILLLL